MSASPERVLTTALGGRWHVRALGASGFCATWRAEGTAGALFVKTLPLNRADVLDAEADGLQALAATGTIRVPAVSGCGRDPEAGLAWLALEWLDLKTPDGGFGARLGSALGQLHRAPPAEGGGRFGWRRANFLGTTPQPNAWSASDGAAGWIEFFGQRRLGAMREALAAHQAPATLLHAADRVIAALPRFFDDSDAPRASLIHGDLWSGNWAMLADGTPVIYDPAVSCSDAAAELAMMTLFGAPPADFWPAYREAAGRPTCPGDATRERLYQFHHLLNHALLFGGGYRARAEAAARALTPV